MTLKPETKAKSWQHFNQSIVLFQMNKLEEAIQMIDKVLSMGKVAIN